MQSSRQRPTKQELKEDEVITWLLQAWTYVEDNYPKLLAGLGVVVVAILVGVFINSYTESQAQDARNALGDLHITLLQGNTSGAIEQAEQMVEDYSGQPSARQALILLGNLYFELGRHAEAQATYQRYLDAHGEEGPSGYGARSGQAACMEAQGNYADAGAEYASYADEYKSTPFAPVALKEAARCYRLVGDVEKSQDIYRRIMSDYAKSSIAPVARAELRQMGIEVN